MVVKDVSKSEKMPVSWKIWIVLFYVGFPLIPICLLAKLDLVLKIYLAVFIGFFFFLLCFEIVRQSWNNGPSATGISLKIAQFWGLLLLAALLYSHTYTSFSALYYIGHYKPIPIFGGNYVIHPAAAGGILFAIVIFLQVLPISRFFLWKRTYHARHAFLYTFMCLISGVLLFVLSQ
jgi:hypothetical protein